MKFTVKIIETLSRTVIVEAKDYSEARDKVADAYRKENLQLHADNSCCIVDFTNATDCYVEIMGQENFEAMEVTQEVLEK